MNHILVVAANRQVTLHFALYLADGSEIDSTRQGTPATFVVGDGNLPTQLEQLLLGMAVGDSIKQSILADQVFGPARDEHRAWLPKADFSPTLELEVGLVMGFQGVGGEGESPGVIKEMNEFNVLVDFNHPLAGQELIFAAEILKISAKQ